MTIFIVAMRMKAMMNVMTSMMLEIMMRMSVMIIMISKPMAN